ncbi:glycine zipper 2TM domain-containing protein [Halomonas cerina]|uniref:Surface antigen n=1 Tax=Halomonas cerina TaxID=447424 RepID=A0A839V5M2_9GAMM|nr:glycine zipper 2TM domain-containing protein [Halomonas cerina]MBB3190672.1 surface antigen [Halomonas cerina]
MMIRLARTLLVALLSLLLLGGCQNLSTREGVATGIGGLVGGALGHQVGGGSGRTIATVIGAGLGAWIGKEIGTRLTPADQQAMDATLDHAPDGQSERWRNPETGNAYTMTPRRTYQDGARQCRDFNLEVVVDGERRSTNGTACRRPDGQSWNTVEA